MIADVQVKDPARKDGMALRFDRYKALIGGTDPRILDGLVRGLLIHYYFHLSDRQIVDVCTTAPTDKKTVNLLTPTLFKGQGRIRLTPTTQFGWTASPGSYSCTTIDVRTPQALIEFGEHTVVNNGSTLIAEGAGIRIGARCQIGGEAFIMDSNFHEMEMGKRHLADGSTRQVLIGDDVFIGARVTILKGSQIGDGCVISTGAVVLGLVVPPMSIVAGNPARVMGRVPQASGE
jgi:acetyltransferase-like isoleucine patch superfamily enzyme